MVGDSNDKNNFADKLLLADSQVLRLCKGFANKLSANVKLPTTQLCKMMHLWAFLGRLLGPLLKADLPLIKIAVKIFMHLQSQKIWAIALQN